MNALAIKFMAFCMGVFYASKADPMVSKDSLIIAPFGKIHLYIPDKTPESLTIMISGDAGWKYGVLAFSDHFALQNSLVVGVDILKYYRQLRSRKEKCYPIVSDFVTLASKIEKKYNFPNYVEPILMGYSSGATLVYVLLAQARPHTFVGGISLGFCPDIELPRRFCEINGLREYSMTKGNSFNLNPVSHLSSRWIVLQGKLDQVCGFQNTADFVKKSKGTELIALDHVGHGFGKWRDFMPQWDKAYRSLITQDKTASLNAENADNDKNIKGLPIDITQATVNDPDAPMVFFISGDGGWYSFEQNLSDHLAKVGVPTIGLDAKKYFWNRRTPQESARDVTKLLDHFSDIWKKNKILLMGYSMGAEVMPFIFDHLTKNIQEKVKKMILLSPDPHGDFEVHITNMLGWGNYQNTYNVVSELKKISPEVPVLIITGDQEDSPLPSDLAATGIMFEKVPGDHHYKNNPLVVFDVLKNKNIIR